MAIQSAGTSPKTKRLGIFPRSFRKFIVAFIIILFLVAGAVWIWQVWGTISNVLGVIFTVAGVIGTILTLWPSSEPIQADTPVSQSLIQQTQPPTPVQVNIYNNAEHHAELQYFPSQGISNSRADGPDSHTTIANADDTATPEVKSSPWSQLSSSQPQAYPLTPPQRFASPSFSPAYGESYIKLTGQEYDELVNALLDAYPDKEDFERMLKVGLNKQLNTLVDGTHNYSNLLFKLLELTEAEGWTKDLVMAAHERRPGNLALQSWQHRYEAGQVSPPTNIAPPLLPQTGRVLPATSGSSGLMQTSVPYQEQQSKQKAGSSPDLEVQKDQELPQASPNLQSLTQARNAIKEARDEVYRFKAIFEGRGDIQQIHYTYVTTSLRAVSACVQNLQQSLPVLFPLLANADRERLFMNLRRIDAQTDDAIAHIGNYDTFNPHQRERNRKDTEARLSSIIADLDDIDGYFMSNGPP